MEEYVNSVLASLLEGDGGFIRYESECGDEITVLIRGECSFCNKLSRCLEWCSEKASAETGRQVKFKAHIVKAYFRDR